MSFNREAVNAAKSFATYGGGHEADPWSLFPTIKIWAGMVHRYRFLTPLDQTVDLWIHDWKGSNHTRTLCAKAHYNRECEICKMPDSYGNTCRPKYYRLALAWDYSLIGTTWTPKSGPNEGVPQPNYPFGVISIPRGEEGSNWNVLDRANADGYGWPDSANQTMLWEVEYISQVGFQPPRAIPDVVLGNIARQVDPAIVQWIQTASVDDKFAQLFATVNDVEWDKFGLVKPPERPRQQGGNDAQPAGRGQARNNTRGTSRPAPQQSNIQLQQSAAQPAFNASGPGVMPFPVPQTAGTQAVPMGGFGVQPGAGFPTAGIAPPASAGFNGFAPQQPPVPAQNQGGLVQTQGSGASGFQGGFPEPGGVHAGGTADFGGTNQAQSAYAHQQVAQNSQQNEIAELEAKLAALQAQREAESNVQAQMSQPTPVQNIPQIPTGEVAAAAAATAFGAGPLFPANSVPGFAPPVAAPQAAPVPDAQAAANDLQNNPAAQAQIAALQAELAAAQAAAPEPAKGKGRRNLVTG